MKDLTVVLIGTNNHKLSEIAIDYTIKTVDPSAVLVYSDLQIGKYTTHIINKISHIKEYSYLCLKCLAPFISTSHIMIIQYDGFAVNRKFWSDEFLQYDYIGAPWVGPKWDKMKGLSVGNGGFSIRSKKLLDALQDKAININERIYYGANEDYLICLEHRKLLEDTYGIRFAPKSLATDFSNEYGNYFDTLGFHGIWNIPHYFSEFECIKIYNELENCGWYSGTKEIFIANSLERGYLNLFSLVTTK